MHEEVHERPEDHSSKDGVSCQEGELAAGQVVDRGGSDGDDEMEKDAEDGGSRSSVVRAWAEDAGSDGLRDEDWLGWGVDDDGVEQVEHADDQAADEDCGQRAWVRGSVHGFVIE